MYQLLFRLLLHRIEPERAHALGKRALQLVRARSWGRAVMRFLVGPIASCLETRAFGLTFSSPLGVAAGLDKDASWFEDLAALGFGFVEVGTITAQAQEGNAPPRLIRLAQEGALVNRMGFPNPGAAVAAGRLARRGPGPVVGVNIGKSMAVPVEDAIADYRAAASTLASVSDYIVLNVSSPNTEGLRALQATEPLRSLITAVRNELAAIGCARPLLIKVGPDLEDEEIDGIVAVALELQLDGIVAVNTTVDRSALTEASARVASFDAGGVSGAPLRARAMEVLRRIRRLANDRLVLISVGGVGGAEDVWERIRAGATLVQVYTAFIYEGPAWPRRVNRELARRVREAGVSSIGEMVGAEERDPHDRGDLSPRGSEPSRGGQRGDGGGRVENEAAARPSRRR